MYLLYALIAAAQPAAPPAPAQPVTAQTFVREIQPRLPQPFAADVSLVGVRAEGDLLVLTVEASAARLAALTPVGIESAVAAAFCGPASAPAIMAGPLSLRVDARAAGGQTITGTALDACPLAAPEGPLPPPRR